MKTVSRLLFIAVTGMAYCVESADAQRSVDTQSFQLNGVDHDRTAALGMRLFTDIQLSADRKVSCATCHIPQKAFTDGLPVASGTGGQRGTRNTPSLWDAASLPNQFWDGRRLTLEEQALDPLLNPKEHGLADLDALLTTILENREYVEEFETAFSLSGSEQIRAEHVALALAAFERTLISGASAFDDYYYDGKQAAMSGPAVRGLALFQGRAGCAKCHVIEGTRAPFTDRQFHSLGVSLDAILPRLADLTQRVTSTVDRSAMDRLIMQDADIAALGRFVVTNDPRDIGSFRTPSLRNVALTAPYMHDGSAATLEAAVDMEIYYRSLQSGQPLILTPKEKADLISFLESLTSANAQDFPHPRSLKN